MNWLLAFSLISNTLASTGTERSVELIPKEAVGIEHGNITLTCSSKVDIGITTWTCPDAPKGQNVFVEGNKCLLSAPFDNATKYLWNCNDSKQIVVTIKDISRHQNGDKWVCLVNLATHSNEATLYVKVPVEQVTLRIQAATSNDKGVIDLNENETVSVTCNTSNSRPNATILFYVSNQNYTVMEIISGDEPMYENGSYDLWQTIQSFSLRPNRTSNAGQIYCMASNGLETKVTSGKIKLNIKYPPTHPPRIDNLRNGSFSLIEGIEGNLTCSTEEANPMASLRWSCNEKDFNFSQSTINNNLKTLGWIASRHKSARCTCQSMHELSGVRTANVILSTLYPAGGIAVSLSMGTLHELNIANNIKLIENVSLVLTLNCSASGNPLPDVHMNSKESILKLLVIRNISGNYTCIANNTMIPDAGVSKITTEKSVYTIDILYPPEIYAKWTQTVIVEGYNINISCTDSPGRTSQQSIVWMNGQGYITFNNSLTIVNVTRQHSGNYTCFVNYTMNPTYGESRTDLIAKVIYIDVQYKPEILNFFAGEMDNNISVTVNENDNVRMVCHADSNPKSTIQISVTNITISSKENTTTLEHVIYRVRCTDTGIYICTAYNTLNANGPLSSKTRQLLVNCSPRRSTNIEIQQNITTSQQGSATFSFVVMAFPSPHFKWLRIANSTLFEANNGFSTVNTLSENEMRIYFTITNIAMTDFGEYVLTINNTFGGYQQPYFLIEKDQVNVDIHTVDVMSVGIIAGVAAGSIIATLFIVAAVYIIHKRVYRKEQTELNKTRELTENNQYQNLTDEGIGISTANESRSPNVYESLQDIGSERQYLELSALDDKNKTGRNNVYLHLRQSHNEMTTQAGDLQEAETNRIKSAGKQST